MLLLLLFILQGVYASRYNISGLHEPVESALDLLRRYLTPSQVSQFKLSVIPSDGDLDVFEISTDGQSILIAGNTGYSISAGIGWYLKYTTKSSLSWGYNGSGNNFNLPDVLPLPNTTRITASSKYKFAYNVCTYGYSMAYRNWDWFIEEIDRLALQGYNIVLLPIGSEWISLGYYESLGLDRESLLDYFSGSAFLPWNRMGNIQSWANNIEGRYPVDYYSNQLFLAKNIASQLRRFGMIPVLSGFAGHVPNVVRTLYPNITGLFVETVWDPLGLPSDMTTTFMTPNYPEYIELATGYNKAMLNALGDPTGQETPLIAADMFNEMSPPNGTAAGISAANANQYASIRAADSSAIYVNQAWLFQSSFWTPDLIAAYLNAVPIGNVLMLDISAAVNPIYNRTENFYGHDFIWGSIIVFGGQRGLFGYMQNIVTLFPQALASASNLVGVGIFPEAIDQQPAQFELVAELGWRNSPVDPLDWLLQWAVRRLVKTDSTTPTTPFLESYVTSWYECCLNNLLDVSTMELLPTVIEKGTRHTNATRQYESFLALVASFSNGEIPFPTASSTVSYDYTDSLRQTRLSLLSDLHGSFGSLVTLAAQNNMSLSAPRIAALIGTSTYAEEILELDRLLMQDENFRLQAWLDEALQWSNDPLEQRLHEFNARIQITTWGPANVTNINDYASKNGWGGLVAQYYGGRWALMLQAIQTSVERSLPLDLSLFLNESLWFENKWAYSTGPTVADPLLVSLAENATRRKQAILDSIGVGQDDHMQLSSWLQRNPFHSGVPVVDTHMQALTDIMKSLERRIHPLTATTKAGALRGAERKSKQPVQELDLLARLAQGYAAGLNFQIIPDVDVAPTPIFENFIRVGVNQTASGPDCPYVGSGQGSLEACQDACYAMPNCNGFNYQTASTSCFMRSCSSPMHPMLIPNQGFDYYTLVVHGQNAFYQCWLTSFDQLAHTCASTPASRDSPDQIGCAGFNSQGMLFLNVSQLIPKKGSYVAVLV